MQFQVISVTHSFVQVCAHCHGDGDSASALCEDAGTEDSVMVNVEMVACGTGVSGGALRLQFPEDEFGSRYEPGAVYDMNLVRSKGEESD